MALRGIGGVQLAVDATQPDAVARLRAAKRRPDKPLAVMAASLADVDAACVLGPAERTALTSAAAPIALLAARPAARRLLACAALAPDGDTLGVMLPTSPLHDLLFQPLPGDPTPALRWLVMTSGNRGGEPLCAGVAEALAALPFADLFLVHDREIARRADDSVVWPRPGGVRVLRRARGFAPAPLVLARPLERCVLALGADLKNVVALGHGDRVVLSPHLGDLADAATRAAAEALVRALPRQLARRVEVVAVDVHSDLGASRVGAALAAEWGVPLVAVQHHHAHAAACLAEHGRDEGLTLVWDGMGLGDDGRLWGGELLHLSADGGCRRLGSFRPARLPGGDAAVREPARQLVGRWVAAHGAGGAAGGAPPGVDRAAAAVWAAQCERGLNAPETTAVGRLFDSAAAALGLAPARVSWEGQAAVRLEAAARRWRGKPPELGLPVTREGALLEVDWRPLFAAL